MLLIGMDNRWLISCIFLYQKPSCGHVRIRREKKKQKRKNFIEKKKKNILETQVIVPIAIVN